MKVLQINSTCGYGSTGRIAVELGAFLLEQGHEFLIAYGRGTAPENVKNLRIGSDMGVNIHGVLSRMTDRHGFYSSRATKEFIKRAEEYNPDIIHLHNIHGYYINIKLLFDWLAQVNKPIVWTLHDCWPFTGHCSHFDFIKCEKWKTGCFSCPQKNEYPTSLFLDSSKRNYEDKRRLFTSVKNMILISPSQWLAEFAKQSFLKKYKTEVINNGIDLETFKPLNQGKFRKDNNLENRFVILGVASKWEERKGLEFFVSLSEKIVENTKIVLVGLNDKQIVGLPKSILTIKRTDSVQELAEIYSTADVFVNPTMEDNFPTTNLEALACGTPVVTFDTGGSPESIDEQTGYIVERGNTDLLLEKIQSVREKGKAAYTANCVNRAKAKYGKTDRFAEYLACYKNILG